jgi:hypothetical protein
MLAATLHDEQVSPVVVGQLGFGRWDESLTPDVLETVLHAMADTGHRDTAIGILATRLRSNVGETEHWKPLALELVTAADLIRSHQTASFCWAEVAKAIVADYPREIAAAIFREQATRGADVWFAEHSEAASVLVACAEKDAGKVWEAIKPYISSPVDACFFAVGFPRGLLERMPQDAVEAWVADEPEERAAIVARLLNKDMSNDGTLASRLLCKYGDKRAVASAFFCDYTTGSWYGPDSAHWEQLADSLDAVATRTAFPKLRCWASNSARHLRKMAQQDRQREEEEDVRGR